MTNITISKPSSSHEAKPMWRIAMGPPPEPHAPFRRHPDGKSYASVAASMPKKQSPPATPAPSPPASSPPAVSRGKIAFLKGGKFENDLGKILSRLYDVQNNEPLLKNFVPSNAPAEEEDFLVQWRGKEIGIEAKNFGTSEGGQRAFSLQDGKLVIPDLARNRIHRACLPTDFVPFEGRIPSFKKGDLTRETWDKERHLFRDEHIRCSPTAIADYYRMKGSSYIQIQDMGLYHTGVDVCGWGVPLFKCATRMRIRCKTHKGIVPTTVQAALNYNKDRLEKSPYCLMAGPLPSSLLLKN
jgi:hypothetical protein